MKTWISVMLTICTFNFCLAQDLKVIGGDEISINVQIGEAEHFEIGLKNISNNNLVIKYLECSNSEISLPEDSGNIEIKAGGKIKYKLIVRPEHSGKQRFRVLVRYSKNDQNKQIGFTIKINPKY